MFIKRIATAGAALLALAVVTSGAGATTMSGTFGVSIYQGINPGNQITDPFEQAQYGSPLLAPQYLVYTGTYTGALAFNASGNSLGTFFNNDVGLTASLTSLGLYNNQLSNAPFHFTTMMVFTGNTNGFTLGGTILHDDGISLYQGVGFGSTVVTSPLPTTAISTAFSNLSGPFQLLYVAANGNPSVLNVDITSSRENAPEPTPLPPAAFLMGSILAGGAGFSAWRRRRRA